MSFDLKKELLLRAINSYANNIKIINILQLLLSQYRANNIALQKINSIAKAISSISNLDYNITSGSRPKIPGVGIKIAARIDEILATGTLAELTQEVNAVIELCSITGIGPVKAKQLLSMGIDSVSALQHAYQTGIIGIKKNELTHHIVIGLKYYESIKERIPWDEVAEFKNIITKLLPENYSVIICGSFRRKMKTCGDIDILLTHKKFKTDEDINISANYLSTFITVLTEAGIIVDNLTSEGKTKYMGIAKLNETGLGRRIDIRLISKEAKPFALLYFTGSGEFNKIMRARALDLGYSLNEYYITRIETGEHIHLSTEKEIFALLDCAYVKPIYR